MYTAKVQNSGGEILTLTQNERNWQVISIAGLNPPPSQINTTNIAGLDGAKFNSSKLNTRNIVIMLKINGEVERNRQYLYNFFRTKENCIFYFANQNRNVSIRGYVETVECDLFSSREIMQASIICPNPYFQSVAEIVSDVSDEAAAFSFPFSINIGSPIPFSVFVEGRITNIQNNSESETGMLIQIDFTGSVNSIKIQNTDTGESMTLNYAFLANDKVFINTKKGEKSIRLLRDGVETNLFSAMAQGSVFFQLHIGDNHFGYSADSGASDSHVSIIFTYSNVYRGV